MSCFEVWYRHEPYSTNGPVAVLVVKPEGSKGTVEPGTRAHDESSEEMTLSPSSTCGSLGGSSCGDPAEQPMPPLTLHGLTPEPAANSMGSGFARPIAAPLPPGRLSFPPRAGLHRSAAAAPPGARRGSYHHGIGVEARSCTRSGGSCIGGCGCSGAAGSCQPRAPAEQQAQPRWLA
eukprot:RCo002895